MQDVPQPSDTSYQEGDRVFVYLSEDDPDSRFHGSLCEVLEATMDDLDRVGGRELDAYQYRVRDLESGEDFPVSFRHMDLVPESEWDPER
jgi:hypothetical protein